jgi:type I restriction enzyme S subunit
MTSRAELNPTKASAKEDNVGVRFSSRCTDTLKTSEEWVYTTLKHVSTIKTGAKNNQDKEPGGKYPFFVRSANVERINSASYDGEAILIPGEGGIGSIFHFVNGKHEVHQRVYRISDFSSDIHARFLYFYMMNFFGPYAMRNSVKATVDSLRLPTFLEFPIRMPQSYSEQERIVCALEDVHLLIESQNRLIAKKRLMKQGAMHQLLTGLTRLPGFNDDWADTSLGQAASISTGRKDVNEGSPSGKYPFFTCSREISFSDSYSFDSEAILIAGNGDVGNLHYYNGKFEAYQRTYVIQNFQCNTQYLWQVLSFGLVKALGLNTLGTSIPYIKKENLTNFYFNVPSSNSEQMAIANVLSDMDAEIDALEVRRDKTILIKTGMMQNLLTGKVRL